MDTPSRPQAASYVDTPLQWNRICQRAAAFFLGFSGGAAGIHWGGFALIWTLATSPEKPAWVGWTIMVYSAGCLFGLIGSFLTFFTARWALVALLSAAAVGAVSTAILFLVGESRRLDTALYAGPVILLLASAALTVTSQRSGSSADNNA